MTSQTVSGELWRKLRLLRDNPVGVGRVLLRQVQAAWARQRLADNDVLEVIRAFVAKRPPNALPPDYADLWFLYRQVKARKPKVVLEFGSGCSTVVLAQALYHIGREAAELRGHLYAVDGEAAWAESTAAALPRHSRTLCTVSYSPLL